jgi:MFS family permease
MLAAGLCLAAAVAIWALIAGRFGETSGRVLLTSLAAAIYTLGGLAGSTALPLKNRSRRVGELTVALSQLTLALAIALIWIPGAMHDDVLRRAFGVMSVLLLAGAHASLLLSRLTNLDTRAVHRLSQGAIVFATSAALLVGDLFAANDGPIASSVWRLLGVLVILAVLNTLLVPLARKIPRDAERPNGDHPGPALGRASRS